MQDLPFNEDWGTLNHQNGRVGDREVLNSGIYTAGWIKRGPSGVIGTNKPDAVETVESLLEDLEHLPHCPQPLDHALIKFLDQKKIKYFTYEDWQKIDAEEVKRGEAVGKPREKFVKVDEMLKVVGKE